MELSDLQKKILRLVATRRQKRSKGHPTNREIAILVGTSHNQVRFHIRCINWKLRTRGDTEQAVRIAIKKELI